MPEQEPRARSSREADEELTVWEHVAELRRYVLLSVASVLVFGSLTHAYRNELVGLLLRPLGEGMTLQFLSPLDPLLFILTLDLMGGVLLSLPGDPLGPLPLPRPRPAPGAGRVGLPRAPWVRGV